MPSAPAAPPPPPAETSPFAPAPGTVAATIFTVTGTGPDDSVIEFLTPPTDGPRRIITPSAGGPPPAKPAAAAAPAVSLRSIVGRYLGAAQQRTFPASRLWLVLGRLRAFQHALTRYNAGIAMAAGEGGDNSAFTQYWRPTVLEQLSSYGFQLADTKVPITVDGLPELIAAMEGIYASDMEEARELIAAGLITFEGLGELYRPDVPVRGVTSLSGTPGVFQVVESYYEERRSLVGMEKSFHIIFEFIVALGEHFAVARFTEVLSGWMGVRARSLSELSYVPIVSAEERNALRARGERCVDILGSGGPQFLAYAPHTFFIHPSGSASSATSSAGLARSGNSLLSKGGRMIVDPARGALLGHHASQGYDESTNVMVQLAGRYRRWRNSTTASSSSSSSGGSGGAGAGAGASSAGPEGFMLWTKVPADLVIFCWPALVGFSFSAKAWGHVLVSGLAPIEFQDSAFDQLVLAEDRKQLIRALVRFGGENTGEDIVGGKRGGSVFLLHGPPGVGKTLTAEAIAEVLHRPLYYVSMGELGLTPDEMEKRLSDVLELCAGWNALTLLDEADVFLEQRATSDIVRNAMVCVMLRLLEYHPGILFLTTNRVRSFDPAFESRVTVALRYDQLTEAARAQIWKNLLHRVTVPVAADVDYTQLGTHILNGRQIKNSVRLAVALAQERGSAVTQAILETTLQITNLGREEMKADDSWKGT